MTKIVKKNYTTGEVATICNVSPSTIFRAISNNQLTASTTPGGHFRISHEELIRFLRKNNIALPDGSESTIRILIIEDNYLQLRLFTRIFSNDERFKVKGTQNGYQAGFLTESFKPDLILMDIFLGGTDGRDIAKLIRSAPNLKMTKIIAITGTLDEVEISKIRRWGFDAFVQKPISPSELLKVVERLVG